MNRYAILDGTIIENVVVQNEADSDEWVLIPDNNITVGWFYDKETHSFFEGREQTYDTVRNNIKQVASIMIGNLENGWKMQRALDRIKQFGDYSDYDSILAKKEYIRVESSKAEDYVLTLSQTQLQDYKFELNLDNAPAIPIKRITVFAFIYRFTPTEFVKIKQLGETDHRVGHILFSLPGWTHIDLELQETVDMINLFAQHGILGEVHEPKQFTSRVHEILREGATKEMYRGG